MVNEGLVLNPSPYTIVSEVSTVHTAHSKNHRILTNNAVVISRNHIRRNNVNVSVGQIEPGREYNFRGTYEHDCNSQNIGNGDARTRHFDVTKPDSDAADRICDVRGLVARIPIAVFRRMVADRNTTNERTK